MVKGKKRKKVFDFSMIVEKEMGKYWWVIGEHGVHLVMLSDGRFICSCAGWLKAKNHVCKHVKEVLQYESKVR